MEEAGRLDPITPNNSPSSSTTRAQSEAVQSSWPRRSIGRERTPLSRFLNSGIRQLPRQLMQGNLSGQSTGVSESSSSVQTQQETESSGQPPVTEALSSFPTHIPAAVMLPSITKSYSIISYNLYTQQFSPI